MGVPPRLIDLSIARRLERAARSAGRSAPTPTWRPSSARRRHGRAPPTDVWGLGATLHHAVSGSKPFPRREERFPQLTERAGAARRRACRTRLRELIEAMLAFEPGRPARRRARSCMALEPLVEALPRKLAFAKRGTQLPLSVTSRRRALCCRREPVNEEERREAPQFDLHGPRGRRRRARRRTSSPGRAGRHGRRWWRCCLLLHAAALGRRRPGRRRRRPAGRPVEVRLRQGRRRRRRRQLRARQR